jgi:sarcosine oxidase gamma subunit
MPSLWLLLLFVSSLVVSPLAWAQNPAEVTPNAPDKTHKCSVAGTVLRKGTDEPIHFARVTLESDDEGQKKLHAATDAAGKFSFKDVAPAEYHLSVTRNGYVSEYYGARGPMDPGLPLTLTSGKHMDDLIFRMTPAGIITGRVRDENGEPLPGTQVTALLTAYEGGKRTLVPASIAEANDLGEFRLYNLAPGKYLLSAGYESNSRMNRAFARLLGNQEEREGLVTTYFPGTTDPAQASGISVDAGAELHSMDFSLQPSSLFHVRGNVSGMNAGTSGFPGVVMLRKASSGLTAMMPGKNATINPKDGSFDLEEVPPGSYDVIAFEIAEKTPRMTHKLVEVRGADVEGVQLVFEPGVTIKGHLRWDVKPPAEVALSVSLLADEESFGPSPTAEVHPDGTFELTGVTPDSYSLNVEGPAPDAYLKGAQYGSSDALGAVNVSAGSSAELDLLVGAHGGHIQGTVSNSDPVAVAGVWVTLVPEEPNRKQKRLYQSVRSGANGKYEFRGVAPGPYDLFGWDSVQEHEWEDPEFLKMYQTKSVSITVGEGETKSVDLTTIRTKSGEVGNP